MEKHEHCLDNIALIVFAKTLDASVKTRIARTEGKAVADRIYLELLKVTAEVINAFPYYVAFTGGSLPGGLRSIYRNAISFFPQDGEDLGARMGNACLHCHSLGFSSFIVIGCDCPERTAGDIIQTTEALQNGYDVVLGPTEDGGYHLAGVNCRGLKIFETTKWSSKDLLKETVSIARSNDLRYSLLADRKDINMIEDYLLWKSRINESDVST